MTDNGWTARKWLLFVLLDILVIAIFLGLRMLCRREMGQADVAEGTITELAS